MMRRIWSAVIAVVLFAGWGGAAGAATVYTDTVLTSGAEYLGVFELPLQLPGTYSVTATDLKWLNTPLQALSFGVFTSTQTLATRVGAGTLEFFNAGTSKVFLQLYARTAAPRYAGLVGLDATAVAVVPLPASLVLLVSALVATWLAGLRRRFAGGWVRSAEAVAV
jgi:hypothetical protein